MDHQLIFHGFIIFHDFMFHGFMRPAHCNYKDYKLKGTIIFVPSRQLICKNLIVKIEPVKLVVLW